MAIGSITITAPRSTVVDFSIPYVEEKWGLLSQIPFAQPKWKALFWPFHIEVWTGILLSCLIFGPIFFMVLNLSDGEIEMKLQDCILQSTKALFRQCMLSIFIPKLASYNNLLHYFSFKQMASKDASKSYVYCLVFLCHGN